MNALVPQKPASMLLDPKGFEHLQRVGMMLASSPLFPDHLRKGTKEEATANGVLVVNMAMRLNEDPLTVAQNIYFVSGKPGWSASYMIGKANQNGVFKGRIKWRKSGQGDTLSLTAFATLAETGEEVTATCDMEMAKAEGWTRNAKYKSMPEQMLRYRSATFLIRTTCPEVMVGLPSGPELEGGMKDVTPENNDLFENDTETVEHVADAEIVKEDEPETVDQETGEVTEAETTEEPQGDNEITKSDEPEQSQDQAPKWATDLVNAIMNDMLDAGDVDAVMGFREKDIERLKSEAPAAYDDLMAQIETFKAGLKANA